MHKFSFIFLVDLFVVNELCDSIIDFNLLIVYKFSLSVIIFLIYI